MGGGTFLVNVVGTNDETNGLDDQSEQVKEITVSTRPETSGPHFIQAHTPTPGTSMGLDDNVYSRLLRERIIFLGSEVRDENANAICAQLLLLAAEDPGRDINLYINSPGGSVSAGMAIYDTMQYVKPDVVTVAMGFAASMGQFLLTAGAPGKRYALPHARILMHQPSGGMGGSASDIRIQAEAMLRTKKEMAELIAHHTGQSVERIEADSDRDRYFTPQEALEYGFVDHVVESASQVSQGGGTA
ncbi:ATP-dependent Clp protease proteolytic subunit [Jiangella asiatica]|uniref:ATP-dependent Clp protease proteolytic subunit n=2 Tax=Jiangella asiatica TaxID=2530372 RepID=A0A4R5DV77_9ACTN|nr:ATP-dependent Clp protease proteolytic subunit [Jiangella asiatica]